MGRTKEGPVIESFISLRKAGERLGLDPKVIKGAALALGIEMRATGTSLLIDREDFELIRRRLKHPDASTVSA
jgi:hypothetical protein